MELTYSVKNLCDITGLSRRTLHYYDEKGILVPAKNSNGYRRYSQSDLEKLQFILFLKNVGLSLNEMKDVLCMSTNEQRIYLEKHQEALLKEQQKLNKTIDTLHAFIQGKSLLEIESFHNDIVPLHHQYDREAKIKYGETASYKDYEQRQKTMSEEEKKQQHHHFEIEMTEIMENLSSLIKDKPNASQVQVEIKKLHDCFNMVMNCSEATLYHIAKQYVEDRRYQSYFAKFGVEGLPNFIFEAVRYYCKDSDCKCDPIYHR